MKPIGPWLVATIALLGVAGCESSRAGAPSAPLASGDTVILVANLGEAEDDCGCGEMIRDVRAAAKKGVPTKEIDTRRNRDEAKKYRVLVVPTVVFLDPSGQELRRYEGESKEAIARMKVDLGALASAKK